MQLCFTLLFNLIFYIRPNSQTHLSVNGKSMYRARRILMIHLSPNKADGFSSRIECDPIMLDKSNSTTNRVRSFRTRASRVWTVQRMRSGPTWLNKSENVKTNLLWSPGTTADINFFRFPTRVARGIFETRGPPRPIPRLCSGWQYVYLVAAHMRSINYTDSATQTYPSPSLFPMWRFFRSLSCSLPSSPRNCLPAWPPSPRLHHLSHILFPYYPSFSISLVPHLRRLQCSLATQTTRTSEYCMADVTSEVTVATMQLQAHVATATVVDLICGSLFTASGLSPCTNGTACRLQAIFRLLANNPKMRWSRHNREIPYIIVNYMREYTISWFYHEQQHFTTSFACAASFLTSRRARSFNLLSW